ncbi:MAG: C1 family peptidase [bacterium]
MKVRISFSRPIIKYAFWILAVTLLIHHAETHAQQGAVRPTSIDLRPNFEKFGLTPRVQGKRGTCSVFAITQAIEFALAKQGGRIDRLSLEFLNWASNEAAGDTLDGSFFSDLWTGFTKHGICVEKEMPYRSKFDARIQPSATALEDAKTRLEAGLRLHWIKEWDPNRGLTDIELQAVLQTLSEGWPVSGGFLWPKKAVWTDGILEMCPRDHVFDGHSLLIVGYRDDPNKPGGGVLLIRNSGGTSRDGYLTYEYAKAYMNDAVWIDFENPSMED